MGCDFLKATRLRNYLAGGTRSLTLRKGDGVAVVLQKIWPSAHSAKAGDVFIFAQSDGFAERRIATFVFQDLPGR